MQPCSQRSARLALLPLATFAALLALLTGLVAITGCAAGADGAVQVGRPAAATAAGTVYLVRHGETVGEGAERPLSDLGRARAEAIAERLADAGIERILTSRFPRTEETAAPTAARLGLTVEHYGGHRSIADEDLATLADALRATGGVVLVVGHSDTTPEVVRLLGGEPGTPIAHDEHDRLYRVELPSGKTTLERVGPPSS